MQKEVNLSKNINDKLGCRKFGWIHNFDSLQTLLISDSICSVVRSMISWWVKNFLSLLLVVLIFLLLLERKLGWALSPSPFAPHLEWSLNTSVDKISNAICVFCQLVFHFCLWFKFSLAWFYILTKCTKEEEKS